MVVTQKYLKRSTHSIVEYIGECPSHGNTEER